MAQATQVEKTLTKEQLEECSKEFRIAAQGESTMPCDACQGSGKYYGHGSVVNGKFQGYVGTCFRCGGKGRQNLSDFCRNELYDMYYRKIPQ